MPWSKRIAPLLIPSAFVLLCCDPRAQSYYTAFDHEGAPENVGCEDICAPGVTRCELVEECSRTQDPEECAEVLAELEVGAHIVECTRETYGGGASSTGCSAASPGGSAP
jgi:hypothetical protein